MVLCFLAGGGVVGNFCCCCLAPKMAAADHGGVEGGVDFFSGHEMTGGERATPGEAGGREEARELLELREEATESGLGGRSHVLAALLPALPLPLTLTLPPLFWGSDEVAGGP